jgi:hypothetical protein
MSADEIYSNICGGAGYGKTICGILKINRIATVMNKKWPPRVLLRKIRRSV